MQKIPEGMCAVTSTDNGSLVMKLTNNFVTFETNGYTKIEVRDAESLQRARKVRHEEAAKAAAKKAKENANKLRDAYVDDYAPPKWSLEMVGSPAWMKLAEKVEVLSLDTREYLVRKLAKEREPVNIGMGENGYHEDVLQREFDYRISGYRTAYTANSLPPNIAVYTLTPMNHANGLLAHVINSVGFGFDDESQPDYRYFIEGAKVKENKKEELKEKLRDVFLLVFACAKLKSLSTVVLCLLGGDAFCAKFPNGCENYINNYFMPALKMALDQLPKGSRPKQLGMMGNPGDDTMTTLQKFCKGIPCEKYGRVPSICEEDEAAKSLFMNAWDPHSVVGNGNNADESLDGYFGRASAMAYLSFPPVNKNIKYVSSKQLRTITSCLVNPKIQSFAHGVVEDRR